MLLWASKFASKLASKHLWGNIYFAADVHINCLNVNHFHNK